MSAREWTDTEADMALVDAARWLEDDGDAETDASVRERLHGTQSDRHAAMLDIGRALLTLRHERDLLAAECRAWRAWEPEGDMGPLCEPRDVERARAAVDAAGVLGGDDA